MDGAALSIGIDPAFDAAGVKVCLCCARLQGDAPGTDLSVLAQAVRGRLGKATDLPAVAEARAAYKALGKDPSRYRPAAEALVRRALRNESLPSINGWVDLTNAVALETGWSAGIYAVGAIEAPIRLTIGDPDTTMAALGGVDLNTANLPVLVDAAGPFGSPTRDSLRTAVSDSTADVFFVAYGLSKSLELVPVDVLTVLESRLGDMGSVRRQCWSQRT